MNHPKSIPTLDAQRARPPRCASATNVLKPAKLETGLIVGVPPFIAQGETIRVDTAEGTYLERVKSA